jgi:hypothetical protein
MRHLARQILRIALVAVALGASSLNGYAAALAAFEHTHGHHHGTHVHGVHAHAVDATAGDPASSDDDGPAAGDKICKHMHAHCCGATAVPPAECSLKLGDLPRQVVPRAASHIPPGEGASSLFRPPRATA